jgi:organic hydroperoxide reductase OsmC/OhrA
LGASAHAHRERKTRCSRANPEQLFATGWAACFQSALLRFAGSKELDLSDSRVTARVGIRPVSSGGFGLVAALDLDAPGLTRDVVVDLMNRAHDGPSLLKDHARQHGGHADRRRDDHRATGRVTSNEC